MKIDRKKKNKKTKQNSRIVENFGGDHDAGDEQAMDVERDDERVGVAVDEPVYVHERHHEARRAAARVLVDPLHVLVQPYRRRPHAVERAQAPPSAAAQLVVPGDELLQRAGEDGEDPRRDRSVVAARLRQPRLPVLLFAAAAAG